MKLVNFLILVLILVSCNRNKTSLTNELISQKVSTKIVYTLDSIINDSLNEYRIIQYDNNGVEFWLNKDYYRVEYGLNNKTKVLDAFISNISKNSRPVNSFSFFLDEKDTLEYKIPSCESCTIKIDKIDINYNLIKYLNLNKIKISILRLEFYNSELNINEFLNDIDTNIKILSLSSDSQIYLPDNILKYNKLNYIQLHSDSIVYISPNICNLDSLNAIIVGRSKFNKSVFEKFSCNKQKKIIFLYEEGRSGLGYKW